MTSVASVTNALIAPPAPAGTMAAFDLILPSIEFSVATSGCGCPVGHSVRNPSEPEGTTATFSEYATAVEGMPQALLEMAKSREVCRGRPGPPKGPVALRVSAMRHGVIGTKRAALEGGICAEALMVSVTDTVCGVLVAPGAVTEIVPACGPGARPAGLTDTVKPVDVKVTLIQGALGVAVHARVPPPVFETPTACAGVNEFCAV